MRSRPLSSRPSRLPATPAGVAALATAAAAASLVAPLPAAAQVTQVAPASLSVPLQQTFTGQPVGAVDSLLALPGVTFGERFAGQSVGLSGTLDTLSGAATAPLTLLAGAANQNLYLFDLGGDVELQGVSAFGGGAPNVDAIGEGAVSVLFAVDQSEFGFTLEKTDGGTLALGFWGRDGSLLGTLNVSATSPATDLAFRTSDGEARIAGVTMTSSGDANGVAFDNFRFSQAAAAVPEPGTLALLPLGALALAGAAPRLRRNRAAAAA
jgi:hypothetical protein